ncbi:MAG: hypothetical protein Edafosvirus10_33 [Edafosvirus sp.]|uniref:Uncharacterized protein n=1 Tax=Edafosvirus sp. TaxID=2487765 RepID=A0A3G4ZTY2_9VIRU|nr:MAG: hypothetical protein Edafosvirus10_33 [Edafosvirus sp.]
MLKKEFIAGFYFYDRKREEYNIKIYYVPSFDTYLIKKSDWKTDIGQNYFPNYIPSELYILGYGILVNGIIHGPAINLTDVSNKFGEQIVFSIISHLLKIKYEIDDHYIWSERTPTPYYERVKIDINGKRINNIEKWPHCCCPKEQQQCDCWFKK